MDGVKRRALSRLVRAVGGCLFAGALSVPLGPTTTGRAVDQMNSSSMRGVPVPPIPVAPPSNRNWIPGYYLTVPDQATGRPTQVFVPGHWQAVTPEGKVIIPPQSGTVPGTGASEPLPPQSP
jgi:hypothetical protein